MVDPARAMASSAPDEPLLPMTLDLPDEAATAALAARFAALARPGDTIALAGDLGTGKTSFARAFILARAAASGTAVAEVPSPTFTLVQVYDLPDGVVWHVDFYRIGDPSETAELGLHEAAAEGILLVEWAERAPGALDPGCLRIALAFGSAPDARIATVEGGPAWRARLGPLRGSAA